MAQARAIIINGYEFPIKFNGYKHSRNKIHSANTGRNNNGNMVGTILAIKDKFECELAPITPAQAKQIDDIFNSTTMVFDAKVLYLDGTSKTVKVYAGDTITYPWISRAIGENGLIDGVSFSLIEK